MLQFHGNVLQNTPNCTIDKKSGEYAPIPLNIVCAVVHYLLFLYKKINIFAICILQNFSKIFSKTHQISLFLSISRGTMPPNPPNKRVAFATRCMAQSAMQKTPLFKKYLEPPEMKS